jgi:uncharacterized protein YycO
MLNPLASEPSNRDNLQPGDFLFVDIYNGWCFYGYWDHVAIYVGEQRFGRDFWAPAVVEATFDAGVTLTTAYAFWERDKPARIAIKRLIDMPGREGIITNAVDYAISQIGKPFDFMPIPPHKIGDGAYYCCELVWRAYKAAGIDLDSNGGLLVLVDDLYYSPRLELAPSQVTICSIE